MDVVIVRVKIWCCLRLDEARRGNRVVAIVMGAGRFGVRSNVVLIPMLRCDAMRPAGFYSKCGKVKQLKTLLVEKPRVVKPRIVRAE